jgi:hypothetical protein
MLSTWFFTELSSLIQADERFEAKMKVLSELVEHHADEEEEEMIGGASSLRDARLSWVLQRP